jgi:uncharacterized alkaline shock family protein YloU
MDALNRGIAILVILAIAAAGVMTVLIAAEAVGPEDLTEGLLQPQAQDLAGASGGAKAVVFIISAAVALFMLNLLRLELMSAKRERRLVIGSGAEGETTVTQDSVAALAEHLDPSLREVKSIRCRVIVRDTGITIKCRSTVAMGANLPQLCQEMQSDIKKRVQEFTGLAVIDVVVDAKYARTEAKHVMVR